MLLASPRFDAITNRVFDEMEITGFDVVPGKIGAVKGCTRPEFSLVVSPDTFDLFFNSPCGYRGQYHKSRKVGEHANATLISRMANRLIAYANGRTTKHGMDVEAMRQSLAAGSAKIWIDEQGARSQRGGDITELKADLEVEPWRSTANAYVAAPAKYPDPDREIKAVDGVKAPEGAILEVKGAFIDQDGQERVAEDKKDRSLQIHLYGFT